MNAKIKRAEVAVQQRRPAWSYPLQVLLLALAVMAVATLLTLALLSSSGN